MAYLEGGFSLPDAAATVYVIKARAKGAGWSFAKMAIAYSALDADTDRARFCRELPAGDVEEWNDRQNAQWSAVRKVAALALAGRIKNPAPGARDWGAKNLANDVARAEKRITAGLWERIPAPTLNAFYRRRRATIVAAAEARGNR